MSMWRDWWGCLVDNRWVSPWSGRSWRRLHSPMLYMWGRALQGQPKHWPEGKDVFQPLVNDHDLFAHRKQLLSHKGTLQRLDLGAGPRRGRRSSPGLQEVKISRLAKQSLTPLNDVQGMVRWLRTISSHGRILELGTSLGITAAHFAQSGWEVETWEGCPATLDFARKSWRAMGCESSVLGRQGDFADLLARCAPDECWDVVFLDGHHSFDATVHLADRLAQHTTTALVVDDIAWSPGMHRAWRSLQQDVRWDLSFSWRGRGFLVKAPGMRRQKWRLA